MKNHQKSLFFVILTTILVVPYIHANAIETPNDNMMKENSMMKMEDSMMEHVASPREQMKMGIDAHQIQCKSGHQLVFKSTNWSPSCVKSSSVEKLMMIGWAANHDATHAMMQEKMSMEKEMMDDNMMENETISGLK